MRFLFLVEGILLIIAITFLVQFRVITLEELSASRVSVKTRSGRFIRPTFARYRRSIGRTIVDRFSPQLRRDEDRMSEWERRGKERKGEKEGFRRPFGASGAGDP